MLILKVFGFIIIALEMTVAMRSKAQVYGPSSAGMVGSNPAEGTYVRTMCFLRIKKIEQNVKSTLVQALR